MGDSTGLAEDGHRRNVVETMHSMASNLLRHVLPDSQRRTIENLTADLDLSAGDVASKRSAFWIMLGLSSVIATAGVLSDSTATVIGAMIIAPLATPIMGLALGLAKGSARSTLQSAWFVLRGVVLVVGAGAVFSLVLPTSFDLVSNSQIASRTSPGLLDLVAAVATGFAGAIALARRRIGPRLLAAIDIGAGAGILGFGAYLGYRTART